MNDYKIIGDVVSFEDGPYKDVTVKYGRVELIPEGGDSLRLSFEYNVVDGDITAYNQNEFHHYLGGVLHELIEEQLASQQLVYYGGVDLDVPDRE